MNESATIVGFDHISPFDVKKVYQGGGELDLLQRSMPIRACESQW